MKNILKLMIEKIKLQIQILQIQLAILLLQQKRTVPNLKKPIGIIIHHGGGNWDFKQVNRSHKNNWGFRSSLGYYAGYQYFIEFSGKLYWARRDNEEGAHCADPNHPHYYNRNFIGICLQGNTDIKKPPDAQLKTLKELIDKKTKEYNIPVSNILGHRQIVPTICPGKHLFEWLNLYRNKDK